MYRWKYFEISASLQGYTWKLKCKEIFGNLHKPIQGKRTVEDIQPCIKQFLSKANARPTTNVTISLACERTREGLLSTSAQFVITLIGRNEHVWFSFTTKPSHVLFSKDTRYFCTVTITNILIW